MMKPLKKVSVIAGLVCLAAISVNASAKSAGTGTTTANKPTQLQQASVNLAHSRCVRYAKRCYRTKVCSSHHKVRCYKCYRHRGYYKTCSYSRMKHLRHYGYRCYKYSSYYGPKTCSKWYWKTRCYRTCVGRVYH